MGQITVHLSGAPTVASAIWDTDLGRLKMSNSSAHTEDVVATQYIQFYLDDNPISTFTITADETLYGSDIITYEISIIGVVDYTEVPINTKTVLSGAGTEVWVRIRLSGVGGADTYIENLNIKYS